MRVNVERCSAGALVIWFVVVHGGAGHAEGGVRVDNIGGAV